MQTTDRLLPRLLEKPAHEDPAKYLGDRAHIVKVYGRMLARADRITDAIDVSLQSLSLFEAARLNPDRDLKRLMAALADVAELLERIEEFSGRVVLSTDVIPLIEQAVEICRDLTEQDPVRFLPQLREGLAVLLHRYKRAGRTTDAQAISEEM
ncbi:MAG: hypothetical protein M3O70_18770, partial [Actinomycetota bacterium]|nr:hypothetical protein [Actinomycetota bacterium]